MGKHYTKKSKNDWQCHQQIVALGGLSLAARDFSLAAVWMLGSLCCCLA